MGQTRHAHFLRRFLCAAPIALSTVAGCAPLAPDPEPLVPPALAYGLPEVDQVLYMLTDTATFRVDTGELGHMTVIAAFAGTAHMHARPDEARDGVEGEIRFLSFRGSFENLPHPVQRVDETSIGGPFTVRVDARGRIELVDTPSLSQDLLDVVGPESLVRPLFVHLPARPVALEDRWVDTVSTVEHGQDTQTRARSVITTTLAGDTLVDGRHLLLLHTRAETEIELTGRSGGVAVRQRLTGVTTGTVIWDDRLNLLVGRTEEGHLTGTLDMEGTAGVALPITAQVRRTVELVR
jgi:hypothetical protein